MDAIVTYESEQDLPTAQPSEFKKVIVGIAYTFAVEIIFFLIACASITVLWYLVFHCIGLTDHQSTYIYHPYEIKYITIVVGGMKRRVAVRKYLNNHKILCH